MKKVIGGLLVAALLSHPSLLKIDAFAYEIYKSQQRIILVIRQNNAEEEAGPEQIENVLADLDKNTKEISELLKEKSRISARIETAMDLLAYARIPLNEQQMKSFRDYHVQLEDKGTQVQEALKNIDERKDLTLASQEILHTDSNYDFIYQELRAICYYQDDVKSSLNVIVDDGRKALDIIMNENLV